MNNRILVVDDDKTARLFTAGLLRSNYEVVTAASGEEALVIVAQQAPAIVLLDIIMPGIDGYETCRRLKSEFKGKHIQVIMVSVASSEEEQAYAFMVGADAYLVKPIDPYVLRSEVRLHFRLRDAMRRAASIEPQIHSQDEKFKPLLDEYRRQIIATQDVAVFAMARMAESRDEDTGHHLIRVRGYSQLLAEQLRHQSPYSSTITEQFLVDLYRSSPLHDIGKVGISDTILFKPGRLTPEEFEIVKTHTVLGARILEDVVLQGESGSFLEMAVAIARFHHERFDGTGYPAGIHGEEIPLSARIAALADVFDALTSVRPYKPAYSVERARKLICEKSAKHFDPVVVNAFAACFDDFVEIRERHGECVPAAVGPLPDLGCQVDPSSKIPLAIIPG